MLANYAKAFGMEIYYYDPYVLNNMFKKVDNINELVSEVDIITIHINYSEKNKNFINKSIISHFKKGVFLS